MKKYNNLSNEELKELIKKQIQIKNRERSSFIMGLLFGTLIYIIYHMTIF